MDKRVGLIDDELLTSFEKLLGHQPTTEEVQRLTRVKEAFGLRADDAVWSIFMALDYYQALYEQMPERIEQHARLALAQLDDTAQAQLKSSAMQVQHKLADAVVKASHEVAATTSKRLMWRWATLCVLVVTASLTASIWGAWHYGRQTGEAVGYAAARDEQAASDWANTHEGRQARRLADVGSVVRLAQCDQAGWSIKKRDGKRYCVPQPVDGTIYGWPVP